MRYHGWRKSARPHWLAAVAKKRMEAGLAGGEVDSRAAAMCMITRRRFLKSAAEVDRE
jgi:hypothetical protein